LPYYHRESDPLPSARQKDRIGVFKLTRFIATEENLAALSAVQATLESLMAPDGRTRVGCLFLHGPPGVGKTHLVEALVNEFLARSPGSIVARFSAEDIVAGISGRKQETRSFPIDEAREADVLVLEDVQLLASHLLGRSRQFAEPLLELIDHLQAQYKQVVLTASVGPARLDGFPARLTSRFAAGLVVEMRAPGPASRAKILHELAQRRQLAVGTDVLNWVASRLRGSVRELEGAVTQLELLTRAQPEPLTIEGVAKEFRDLREGDQPTIEQIAWHVSDYFGIHLRHLQSARRFRNIILPRQLGMYLARQLTALSLEEIGSFFGGRDHSTVLYACRRVEETLPLDSGVAGAISQIRAQLA
jgi:chromosomal replication initiator protein